MKLLIVFSLSFPTFAFAAAESKSCASRTVAVELEKKQVQKLESLFAFQSDLPYTFEVKSKGKETASVDISYRRMKEGDSYPEPLSPDLFKSVVEKLNGRYGELGIKKVSAAFIPGQCASK